MKRVFLGGTCNGSGWRDEFIPILRIGYFNPVVPDWTPEVQAEELKQRENCDFCLYVITPKMTGVYAIAEVADDSNKRPQKTVFCFLENDGGVSFNSGQIKSLKAVANMVIRNGAVWLENLEEVAKFLNEEASK